MSRNLGILSTVAMVALVMFSAGAATIDNDGAGGQIANGNYIGNAGSIGYDNYTVTTGVAATGGNSATITEDNNKIILNKNPGVGKLTVAGNFTHNGQNAVPGSGGLSFTGNNITITANGMNIAGNFYNGDGLAPYMLTLNVDTIKAANFYAMPNSKMVINPVYAAKPSLTATDATTGLVSIADGLYMGNGALGSESVHINALAPTDVYTIASKDLEINGPVNVANGKLVLNSTLTNIMGDATGTIDATGTDMTVGGDMSGTLGITMADNLTVTGNLNGNKANIKSKSVDVGENASGNLTVAADTMDVGTAGTTGSGNLTGTINLDIGALTVAGNMDANGTIDGGTIDINGAYARGNMTVNVLDMNVAGDLGAAGNKLALDVETLEVGGNLTGTGTITAHEKNSINGTSGGTMTIGGDVAAGMTLNATKNINIGKDLYSSQVTTSGLLVGGNIESGSNIDADTIHVIGDVMGGNVFRANYVDPTTGMHVNSDTGVASDPFKQTNITIDGTYYFDDNSFLQLVLNQKTADFDGDPAYDADLDAALLKVGGFDTSGMTVSPNMSDMSSAPNLEILIDGTFSELKKIKLIESDTPITDLGQMTFAGIWFYDPTHATRLFQEGSLTLSPDSKIVYVNVAVMRSIAELVSQVPADTRNKNDMNMAHAVDDIILQRLLQYDGSTSMDDHYTNVMRFLFPQDDVFYKMMLNATKGSDDAMDVMVANMPGFETSASYLRALKYVRNFGLDDMAGISRGLSISDRLIRDAISDQILDDFTWQRMHDPRVLWGNAAYNTDNDNGKIISLVGGADWQLTENLMLGVDAGYNKYNYDFMTGTAKSFGIYGTYRVLNWAKVYASANYTMHAADIVGDNPLAGQLKSSIKTNNITAELGFMHRIFDQYLNGRAYIYTGQLGGFEMTRTDGLDRPFMDVKSDSKTVLSPGYELVLGKDIYVGTWSFIRPKLRVGVEYDLLGNDKIVGFRFAGSPDYWQWDGSLNNPGSSLWLRYGGQIDFSYWIGTNISLGYEQLTNGSYKSTTIRLSGNLRF